MAVSAVLCWGRAVVLLVSPSLERLRRASLLCRVPGSRALLLAVLTLQCAAKPHWWHGGQPAQTTTSRAHVRRMPSQEQEQKMGLTARRTPDAPQASPETTEAGPRRIPPLLACGRRAVGAEKTRYQQHVEPYNQSWRSALLRPGLVDLGLSAVLPATEEHRQRRGQSRVLHANLDHGRAHRLVGATAGNDTAGQRSGPTATQDKPRTPNGLREDATI